MLKAPIETPKTAPPPPQLEPSDRAEEERRRIAALPYAERQALEKAKRDAEALARQEAQERHEASLAAKRARQQQLTADVAARQCEWAQVRDRLLDEAKAAHDNAIRSRVELDAAYDAGDIQAAVRLRAESETAAEIARRADDRVAEHRRHQPTVSGAVL